jgi:hypothetical protein
MDFQTYYLIFHLFSFPFFFALYMVNIIAIISKIFGIIPEYLFVSNLQSLIPICLIQVKLNSQKLRSMLFLFYSQC